MDKAVSALQDGEFAKKAIELDKNKKIEEAVKYYDLAVYFLKITCNGRKILKIIIFFNFKFSQTNTTSQCYQKRINQTHR